MLQANSKSVNVARTDLLDALKTNLEIHRNDYIEAMYGYKIKLIKDLKKCTKTS